MKIHPWEIQQHLAQPLLRTLVLIISSRGGGGGGGGGSTSIQRPGVRVCTTRGGYGGRSVSKHPVGNGWMMRMREVVSKKGRGELENGEKPTVREVMSRKWGGGGGGSAELEDGTMGRDQQ